MDNLLEILGKIGFDWQVALANLFNFLIIFFILKKFAFKPIGKLIKERQEKINEGILNAEKNEKLLSNTKKEYEDIILDARTEAHKLVQDARKEAIVKKDQLLEQARGEVASMIENGKKSLEIEKIKILDDARKEIVNLVIQVSEKVLGNKVDEAYSSKITKELSNL